MARIVKIHISVYVPDDVAQDEHAVADYLNDKLENDPDFFGEFDTACFTITDEKEPE